MISLIIPIYNVENYIVNSLESAFNQSFKDVEFIIVDDCGTDSSITIAERLINLSPRKKNIKIIHHDRNRGLSAARNTGLQHASGEYVFFMDSDDTITPDCLQLHYDAICNSNAEFSVANINLQGRKSIHINKIDKSIECVNPLLSYLELKWSVSAWNKLYRRDFLIKNSLQFEEGLLHEDFLWSFNLSLCAHRLCVVEKPTYNYIVHDGSIVTGKNSGKRIESLIHIMQEMKSEFQRNQWAASYRRLFYKNFDFIRLTTSILLLNYDGPLNDAKNYYKIIGKISEHAPTSLFGVVLKLPFEVFNLAKPIYNIYKRLRSQ